MIASYNRKSFVFGVPGLLLQIGGNVAVLGASTLAVAGVGRVVSLVGTVLLLVGLAFYAKAKGRHPAWCLFAFLSIIGLIVLASLKDRAPDGQSVET